MNKVKNKKKINKKIDFVQTKVKWLDNAKEGGKTLIT